jgi:hypothetical protein
MYGRNKRSNDSIHGRVNMDHAHCPGEGRSSDKLQRMLCDVQRSPHEGRVGAGSQPLLLHNGKEVSHHRPGEEANAAITCFLAMAKLR